jgi:hypothetical protein
MMLLCFAHREALSEKSAIAPTLLAGIRATANSPSLPRKFQWASRQAVFGKTKHRLFTVAGAAQVCTYKVFLVPV